MEFCAQNPNLVTELVHHVRILTYLRSQKKIVDENSGAHFYEKG